MSHKNLIYALYSQKRKLPVSLNDPCSTPLNKPLYNLHGPQEVLQKKEGAHPRPEPQEVLAASQNCGVYIGVPLFMETPEIVRTIRVE